jgi:hypothetical protein
MKTKKLRELLDRNTTIDAMSRKVSISIFNEYCDISAHFRNEDNWDLDANGLTEFQENIVIHYMKDIWNDNFSEGFYGVLTQQDKLDAIELLYKN